MFSAGDRLSSSEHPAAALLIRLLLTATGRFVCGYLCIYNFITSTKFLSVNIPVVNPRDQFLLFSCLYNWNILYRNPQINGFVKDQYAPQALRLRFCLDYKTTNWKRNIFIIKSAKKWKLISLMFYKPIMAPQKIQIASSSQISVWCGQSLIFFDFSSFFIQLSKITKSTLIHGDLWILKRNKKTITYETNKIDKMQK